MNKQKVLIVILSKNKELAEKFKYAIDLQYNFFKREIHIINKEKDLKDFSEINILILLDPEKYKIKDMEARIEKTVIIDMKKNIIKEDNEKRDISLMKDEKAIAFSIIYNYYKEIKAKEEEKKQYDYEKVKLLVEKFQNSEDDRIKLSKKIDEIIIGNDKSIFIGYKELRSMLILQKVCNIEMQGEYNYIYITLVKILNESEGAIKHNLRNALKILRNRAKDTRIQEVLQMSKGRQVIEQIILLGQVIL